MEGLFFVSVILILLSIFVFALVVVFLYRVPKHLEDIALTLKRMYLFGLDDDDDDPSDDDDCVHPVDVMTDKIKNCETLK